MSTPPSNPVSSNVPIASAASLALSPASYSFSLDQNAPQQFTVTRSNGSFTSLVLSIGDPTVVGVSGPTISGSTASFQVLPIAHGTTSVNATDQNGNSAAAQISTASCGRPPSLVAAQALLPSNGATGVSSSIGRLYFVVYMMRGTTLSGNLHLIVGQHSSLEGGPLVLATPPPGAVLPTPIPLLNAVDFVASASVPPLALGQRYETELYNDTCQPAVIAGTFSI